MKILIWILAALVMCSFASAITNSGLTSCWGFPQGNLTDNIGGLTATAVGTPTNTSGCINGNCYDFDNGLIENLNITHNDKIDFIGNKSTNWTISFWANIDTLGAGGGFIFDKGNCPAFTTYSSLFVRSDPLYRYEYNGNVLSVAATPGTAVWTLLTIVQFSNGTMEIYKNATRTAVGTISASTNSASTNLFLGNCRASDDFNGKIDEVMVFNQSLVSTEVTDLLTTFCSNIALPSTPAPIILNSTYNLTSAIAGQNSTAWRNAHESTPIKTLDTTPTVTFNTVLNAYCRVHTADQNWTTMGNSRNCTTTGTTTHTCTLAAADQYVLGSGYNSLFIGCIESTLANETVLSTSGALNLSLGFSPVINNLALLPSPSFTDSLMNCSFRVVDNDSSVLNVTVNWTGGAYVQYFNNTANNTFLNSTWLHGTAKGTNLTCNVTVSDGETISIAGNKSTVSNSVPYGFSVSSPLNESTVFGTAVNFSWNCSDADAGDTLTSSWVLNGTPNGTDVFPGVHELLNLSYDICYEMFGFCYDTDTANSNDITLYFCTNSTSVCDVVVSGLVDGSRYRSESVNIGLSCLTGLPAVACTVSINSYAPESINCSLANLTLELGRNDVRFNVSGEEKRMIVYAKRLNESGFGAYFVIIILIAVLGFLMMAYNRWLRLGAVAVLIGLGGCVLGASIIAWSFWAGGFVIMCSIFFALYEVMKN